MTDLKILKHLRACLGEASGNATRRAEMERAIYRADVRLQQEYVQYGEIVDEWARARDPRIVAYLRILEQLRCARYGGEPRSSRRATAQLSKEDLPRYKMELARLAAIVHAMLISSSDARG